MASKPVAPTRIIEYVTTSPFPINLCGSKCSDLHFLQTSRGGKKSAEHLLHLPPTRPYLAGCFRQNLGTPIISTPFLPIPFLLLYGSCRNLSRVFCKWLLLFSPVRRLFEVLFHRLNCQYPHKQVYAKLMTTLCITPVSFSCLTSETLHLYQIHQVLIHPELYGSLNRLLLTYSPLS